MVFAFISNIFRGGSNIPAAVTKSFWEDRHPCFGLIDHRYTAAAAAAAAEQVYVYTWYLEYVRFNKCGGIRFCVEAFWSFWGRAACICASCHVSVQWVRPVQCHGLYSPSLSYGPTSIAAARGMVGSTRSFS